MSLVPLGHFQTTGQTLARMIATGRMTLEALDQPPADWPADRPYQNIARNWIQVNEAEWRKLTDEFQAAPAIEVPMASPDPKDLPPMAQGVTPAEVTNLPTTLDNDDWF